MICPDCGTRWSPHRQSHVLITDDPFCIKWIKPEYEQEYEELLMNDIKVCCISCSI